jgi:hypothetical protein
LFEKRDYQPQALVPHEQVHGLQRTGPGHAASLSEIDSIEHFFNDLDTAHEETPPITSELEKLVV